MRVLGKLWLRLWQAARFDIPASGSSYENDRLAPLSRNNQIVT
jgi:hypothetical protein